MTTIQENEKLDTVTGIREPETIGSNQGTDLTEDVPVLNEPSGGTYMEISLNTLRRFHDHPFSDYVGNELEKMVDSIRSKGLIHPIAVRPHPTEDGCYEILSGHNRKAAAEKLGWLTIPAMIHSMTDDDAILFVNEANIAQRRFENWLPSEKAKSIYQYHSGIRRQGKRTDLKTETSGEDNQKTKEKKDENKFDAREETARVYKISVNTVRLYLSLYHLIEPFKKRLDNDKEFGTTLAQTLSAVPPEIQEIVNTVTVEDKDTCRLSVRNAKAVRVDYKDYKIKDADDRVRVKDNIRVILSKTEDTPSMNVSSSLVTTLTMITDQYAELFPDQTPEEALEEMIALVKAERRRTLENVAPIKTDAANETVETTVDGENIENTGITQHDMNSFPRFDKDEQKPSSKTA